MNMHVEYKLKDKVDLWLVVPVLILFGLGLLAIYSSTATHPTASGNFLKQIISGVAAFIVFTIVYSLPTNFFKFAITPAYIVSILLLVAVLFLGRRISGAKSWIFLGPFSFQPSEIAKIATIFALSGFLSKPNTNIENIKDIMIALAIGLFPVGLILLQPDMGSSFVFFGIILVLIFWKGISLFGLFIVLSPPFVAIASLFGVYYFIGAIVLVMAALVFFKKDLIFSGSIVALNLGAGFFADYVYNFLSPHQQKRIQSFIDPMADPLGSGYNALQAKVAIGSGGLFGKGFLHGNQTQLQFIPEQWTDFIYCVIGEEFGFLGAFITVLLFIIILTRIVKIASSTKDEFLSLVLMGVFAVVFVHVLINIGMTIGLLPVIGIPLPFVSYGGSSLLANMLMLGIIANVYRTRKNYT